MQDFTLAFKNIVRSPGFAIAGIGSLALAIAANTIVFGVLNALLLRPLPIERPEELFFMQRGARSRTPSRSTAMFADRAHLFTGFAAYRIAPMALQTESGSQRVWGYLATGNYFDLLGVKPAIGRFFRADEDVTPDAAPYAVLSHAAWRSRFAGDPAIAGRVIRLNGRPFTILGVAPEGFRGTELFYVPEIWVPMMMQPHIEGNSWLENRNTNNTCVLARIRSGVNKEQAEENLNAVGAVLGRELGWNRVPRFTLAAPGSDGRHAAHAGHVVFCGRHAAGGPRVAGRLRQPVGALRRSIARSHSRDGHQARAWRRPRVASRVSSCSKCFFSSWLEVRLDCFSRITPCSS